MRRKRDSSVSSGELDVTVTVIPAASPQARHHFTRFDQVNQLVGASESDADLGFMARMMALCSLPRTNPGNRKEYVRRNGPYNLIMTAIGDSKLPYGSLARLLMAYVSTEAVKTQSREIVFGKSLSDFMRKLDLHPDGGSARGDRTRLRNQMERLFGCSVSLIYEDEHGKRFVRSHIAESGEYWWNPKRPDERMLWDSKIRLGEAFFNEIISHPAPLDMNILKAMKRCSLGLDLYLWLTYRTFALQSPLPLSWQQVYRQFGLDPAKAGDKETIKFFRRQSLRELKKIKIAWPGLNYTTARGVLIILPSTPAIPPAPEPLRLAE